MASKQEARHFVACPLAFAICSDCSLRQYSHVGSLETGIEGDYLGEAQILDHCKVDAIGESPVRVVIIGESSPCAVEDNAVHHKQAHNLRVRDNHVECLRCLYRAEHFESREHLVEHVICHHQAHV